MNTQEFYLWLNGYLEALESEDINVCKIKNIREKMTEVKTRNTQERVVFGKTNIPKQQSYVNPNTNRPIIP